VGDYLGYNGYVVNGIVNALRIQRVLLNWSLPTIYLNSKNCILLSFLKRLNWFYLMLIKSLNLIINK
jgi:hypothetical protein